MSGTISRGKEAKGEGKSGDSFCYNFFMGSGGAALLAGVLEIIIFHPFDTAAKRLMSHQNPVLDITSSSNTRRNVKAVLLAGIKRKKAPGSPITTLDCVKHMYPGSSYAVLYKVLQRFIKFAGQPYVRDYLKQHHAGIFIGNHSQQQQQQHSAVVVKEKQQKQYGSMMLEATAGSIVGVCEVVLLPFDRMKVLNQTNATALQNRSFLHIIRQEGIPKLYAGIGTTMLRNAVGTFTLFGGAACTKEYLFHLQDYSEATVLQNLVSSTIGGCLGVLFTSPMDVIKTRIQNKRFEEGRVTGWRVVRDAVREEGVMAFYKGITPKILTSAPRLVFSYTMTQYLTHWFHEGRTKVATKSTA